MTLKVKDIPKEIFLDAPFLMAHLEHLAEYQKEHLLGMVRSDLEDGTEMVLEELLKVNDIVTRVWDQYQDDYMTQQEMCMDAATWNGDQPTDPDEWTKAEVELFQKWWDKTFPGEENLLNISPIDADQEND